MRANKEKNKTNTAGDDVEPSVKRPDREAEDVLANEVNCALHVLLMIMSLFHDVT